MDSLIEDAPARMNRTEYKMFHAAAMANNEGTTPEHTLLCILVSVLCSYTCVVGRAGRSPRYQQTIEYIGIVVTMILAHTILQNNLFDITKVLIAIICVKCSFRIRFSNIGASFKALNTFSHDRMHCITNIRGLTYLITVFCILAVDFSAFPRVLGKTERYGYSLMDTGVGLFTIGSGIIHKSYPKSGIRMLMMDNWKLLFLLGFGLTRLVALRAVDYHEHVTEYGVHWNFFYTLFATKLMGVVLLHWAGVQRALSLSMAVLVLHQVLLSSGLESWVFSDARRDDLVSANREGLASVLGYVSLYIFGAFLKDLFTDRTVLRVKVLIKITLISIFSYVLATRTSDFAPVSRTLANAGYCMFVISAFTMVTMLFYILEVVMHDHGTSSVPFILDAFNNNGLLLFLLANALTGAVNLTLQPLLVPTLPSIFLLHCYMFLLFYAAIVLDRRGIRL